MYAFFLGLCKAVRLQMIQLFNSIIMRPRYTLSTVVYIRFGLSQTFNGRQLTEDPWLLAPCNTIVFVHIMRGLRGESAPSPTNLQIKTSLNLHYKITTNMPQTP